MILDPASFPKELEAQTRSRLDSLEWGKASQDSIRHDDFELDADFEPYQPSGGRGDRFTREFDDLPIFINEVSDALVYGPEMLVCDHREPTLSNERLSHVNLGNISAAIGTLRSLEVPRGVALLVGVNAAYPGFYHWCFQCLPAIELLRRFARREGMDYRLVLPPLNAFQRESLELLRVMPEECLELPTDSLIEHASVVYSSVTSSNYVFQPSNRLIGLLDDYRVNALACSARTRPGAELPTRFYVSRRDAPRKRPLVNSSTLACELAARGVEEVVMSELSLADQVSMFANAETIVAPHGAALVNLMFSPDTARLVEILPEHYRHACFFRLCQARGIRYLQVLSRLESEEADTSRHQSRLHVGIDKVIAALDRAERSSR